jgi:Zn-finger nucleic acid-binding protein
MNCPVRSNVQLVMTERKGIEIDYCPQCRGVWLDRGELDKIIDRSANELREEENRRYDRPAEKHRYKDDDDKHSYKRRKSIWSEIFD